MVPMDRGCEVHPLKWIMGMDFGSGGSRGVIHSLNCGHVDVYKWLIVEGNNQQQWLDIPSIRSFYRIMLRNGHSGEADIRMHTPFHCNGFSISALAVAATLAHASFELTNASNSN